MTEPTIPELVTTPGPTQNSYVTRADAEFYCSTQVPTAACSKFLNDMSDYEQVVYLIRATRYIDQLFQSYWAAGDDTQVLQFPGYEVPKMGTWATGDQLANFWPNDVVPRDVMNATVEMALVLVEGDIADTSSSAGIKILESDGNKIEYFENSVMNTRTLLNTNVEMLMRKFARYVPVAADPDSIKHDSTSLVVGQWVK